MTQTSSNHKESQKPVLTMMKGWGRTSPTAAQLVPMSVAKDAIKDGGGASARGVIARGLGRSYGDCAQNGGGLVADGPSQSGIIEADLESGAVRASAGTSLDDLMRWFVPLGFFVPVTPGTRFVTVGGAIAADVHGKNHHVAGSWGNHVLSMRLIDGLGNLRELSPTQDPELFWATTGGMGLTGLITGARIRMRTIETSRLRVDTMRAEGLDDLIAAMYEADSTHRYSVAWVDTLARGKKLGRSVLTVGDFASVDDLPVKQRSNPLSYDPTSPLGAPKVMPEFALNRWSVAAFNEMWFRKAPKRRVDELQSIATFFHPLDGVNDWNYIYGRRGFLQYQVIVPDGHEDVLRRLLEQFADSRSPVFLAVLKRFGPEGPSPITFALKGWTLALDIPTDVPGLSALLDGMDEDVAAAGGRIYLTKDSRMSPETFRAMYPKAKDFGRVRDRVDPERKFRSDLSERLGL